MTITAPRADLDLLMRSAEDLLSAATDETKLLDVATELLSAHYGYGARYVALHDDQTNELYLGGAADALALRDALRDYRAADSQGLSGACWTSGRVVNAPDVHADPRYLEIVSTTRSEICVPIVAGEKVLGVLGLQSDQLGAFSADDEQLLSAYARLLAMALTHARIHKARQSDIAELQAISDIAQRAAALDLNATLASVCEALRKLTTSDSVAVYLYDERGEQLSAANVSYDAQLYDEDYATAVRSTAIRVGTGIIGWVAQHREPLLLNDVAADERAIPITGTPLTDKSAIVIPLLAEDQLVGVARAVKMGLHSYTPDHFRFAQTLASQAALAIAAAKAHEEIRRLSVTDELTGAYNARHVMQRLREEIEFARRHDDNVSLLVIDFDRMKQANDQYGHAEGNHLLVDVTDTIRASLRGTDVLGRFGGDEFVVVLARTAPEQALITAERVRLAVAQREFRTSWGERIRATASVGVSSYPQDGTDGDQLFRAGDSALYKAKQAGRNRVHSGR